MFKGVPKIDDAQVALCDASEMRCGCWKSNAGVMQHSGVTHNGLSAWEKTRQRQTSWQASDVVPKIVPLVTITVVEALQLWSGILQHDDVELAAIRVRSPVSWHNDAFNVRDGKETLICVGLTVRRLNVLMKKEFGEHAL